VCLLDGDALFYGKSIRGHRLLLPDGKIIIRRHVRFIEDSFPFRFPQNMVLIILVAEFNIIQDVVHDRNELVEEKNPMEDMNDDQMMRIM
jgi:hypothetical protein